MNTLLKKYQAFVERNEHTRAAKLLVDTFGKKGDQEEMNVIYNRSTVWDNKLSDEDRERRDELSRKYYKKLLRN